MKQGALYDAFSPDRQFGTWTLELLVFTGIQTQHNPGIQLGDITVEMERKSIYFNGLAHRLNAFYRPHASANPQVFDGVAPLFIAFRGQLCHGNAFLHVGVIAVQFLELQGMAIQRRHDFAKTLIAGLQITVAEVQLLTLRIVDA
ncbi:protein BatD [Pseudomonas syringae pv. spinaceae]|uniref:Protein BatD n=1 Tax=Pseudomonas syringae pv. spinaceae TaxID=264459 RepID=A0A0Q0D8K4_PSESX|nr:protein BatD [Pseudomonas syringae pv. spinaceae]